MSDDKRPTPPEEIRYTAVIPGWYTMAVGVGMIRTNLRITTPTTWTTIRFEDEAG